VKFKARRRDVPSFLLGLLCLAVTALIVTHVIGGVLPIIISLAAPLVLILLALLALSALRR